MKISKKITSILLALTFVIGLFAMPSNAVKAQSYGSVPKKVRIYSDSTYQTFSFDLGGYGYSIKGLKSNSSKLKVKQTYQRTEQGTSTNQNYATITLLANKEGNYKVSFNIVDAAGKKVSAHTVKVYAKNDSVLKTLKVGKNDVFSANNLNYSLLKGNSGKVKVAMSKGYKLKKIEYGVYDNNKSEYVYSTIKNNKKITYGKQVSEYSYSYESAYSSYKYNYWSKSAMATTYIRITYIDKYTKTQDTISYAFYRWVD